MTGITPEQYGALLRPIKPQRVLQANGQSHVPGYDVIAHLTRIFGFDGWGNEIKQLSCIAENPTKMNNGKEGWTVTYLCHMKLIIKNDNSLAFGASPIIFEDASCGSATNPQLGEAHDMALKSAITYAIKRCAKNLGDQFGLSLYNKGSMAPLVGTTLNPPKEKAVAPDVESHIPEPKSLGNDEKDGTEPFE